ncbi:ferredoxin [Nonomuraea sp. K274]|uniref:Ferredoxin n=1 Tax=Nonomuraea cypriaca TaxID=1187855 RepID=A0A931A180_9ACTN|nr:ferredoxin [Nonomuraea cypriaca]MBF8184317.1 ferredoxin [Nonomuraea cypriaca]
MRVILDTQNCQAYGNCMLTAPDVFDLDEEAGTAIILRERPPAELRAAVEEAVRSCPVQALTLED